MGIASWKANEEDGALIFRLRLSEAPARVEFKFNLNHDPGNGQFTFGSGAEGAKLTPEAKAVADRIGRDFLLRTGKRVQVNSGTRSPKKQAEAMLGKLGDWSIYKDRQAIAEIRAVYLTSKSAGRTYDEQANAMAEVIRRQMARGVYVSDHLRSHALDLSVANLAPRERAILVEISRKHAKKVLDEHRPPHVHVKY